MYGMLTRGDSICVGLSGGADSVSLLVALNELKDYYGISLEAVHVNHQLRGEESLRDEYFCIELCNSLNVPLHVERIDVTSYCSTNKVSTEEGARVLRYEVFSKVAKGKVATAHTLSDTCETMLYNLARGTGSKGLMGIPPVRGNIIRPLILCTRQNVENYLQSKGYSFVTDSTNLLDDYTRNKLRHNVIPVLKGINPKFESKVLDTITILGEDNDYLDTIANGLYTANISKDGKSLNVDLRGYHNAIRHRCITRFLKDNSLPYSHDRLLAIDSILANDSQLTVGEELYITATLGRLSIVTIVKATKQCIALENTSTKLVVNGTTELFNKLVETKLLPKDRYVHKKLTYYYLDYDKIQGETLLRGRHFGDKIQLKGRDFTSSVKKLINEKVPKECRDTLCFIQDDVGLIFMERFGVAQRVSCDEHTKHYLVIKVVEKS
jgi:tRNA(Ile)-lysidine synthase